eukprot:6713328-Pyramimonas_sp.AAC.1
MGDHVPGGAPVKDHSAGKPVRLGESHLRIISLGWVTEALVRRPRERGTSNEERHGNAIAGLNDSNVIGPNSLQYAVLLNLLGVTVADGIVLPVVQGAAKDEPLPRGRKEWQR